jgi:hypothetical protein
VATWVVDLANPSSAQVATGIGARDEEPGAPSPNQHHGTRQAGVQHDLAVEPTTPGRAPRTLTPAEITAAIAYNTRTITAPAEISLIRNIIGLSPQPADIDAEFVQAVSDYQVVYGLQPDGMIGGLTRRRLSLEIVAAAEVVGPARLGDLAVGVDLRSRIRQLITAGTTAYANFSTAIRAATALQRDVVLAVPSELRRLQAHLTTWDDFARCVELLGRRAPTFGELTRAPVVQAALQNAWGASNAAVNPPQAHQHEEGGWVYLNLITNELAVQRQAAGAGHEIDLHQPPVVADSIVVAKFHTHPNLGPGWRAEPSQGAAGDQGVDAGHGVPDIVVGTTGVNPATFTTFASGPDRRLHLAGDRGLPGAAGGVAP